MPNVFYVNITQASDAEIILSSTKHTNKSFVYTFVHPFLKTGLLTSNGKKWLERRKLLTPTFHFSILQQFYTTFKEQGDRLVNEIDNEIQINDDDGINVHEMISRFTLNTITGLYWSFCKKYML